MDRATIQILDIGQGKIEEAYILLHPVGGAPPDKAKLFSLRKWFFESGSQIKKALHEGNHIYDERRCQLERLITHYTVAICKIDEAIIKYYNFGR